jgi:glycosyltransferase involved in cell wall biosynthesis
MARRVRTPVSDDAAVRRPKLLVLASTYPRWPGDPEPGFVHELARRLVPEFDVRVICPHAPGAKAREVFDGVDVLRFRYAPASFETLVNDGGLIGNLRRSKWKFLLLPLFALGFLLAVRRSSSSWSPAVIHAHWLVPQGLFALLATIGLRRQIPLVVTAHGADVFALRGALFDACRRRVAARAARVTVVSAAMKDRLVTLGTQADKIAVASMGVDFRAAFVPDLHAPRAAYELLFVGRLVEKKGLSVLLQAMPSIVAAAPAVRLTVIGFGPEEATLKALTERLGISERVDFLGPISQASLPAFYRRATVFVAPFVEAASGDQEGLGLVALEASGCGCPVVISDLPATRDVFAERVVSGSAPALAAAILVQLHASPAMREAFARSQRQRLVDDYDWQHVATGYARLIGDAIDVEGAAA